MTPEEETRWNAALQRNLEKMNEMARQTTMYPWLGALAPGSVVPVTTTTGTVQMPLPYPAPAPPGPSSEERKRLVEDQFVYVEQIPVGTLVICRACSALIAWEDAGAARHRAGCIPAFPTTEVDSL